MTRHSTDRTNEESRQAYEAMNLRQRKVHRMTRDVAVLREGRDCEDGEPTREQWRRAQRLTQRLYGIASKW
jgi:hypothetical protein